MTAVIAWDRDGAARRRAPLRTAVRLPSRRRTRHQRQRQEATGRKYADFYSSNAASQHKWNATQFGAGKNGLHLGWARGAFYTVSEFFNAVCLKFK